MKGRRWLQDMSLLAQLRATPNLLTLFRLFTIPFLVTNLLDHRNRLALLLFVMAGATDALDGQIARRFGQSTRVGQYLDPIADKLMLSTLFLTATHMHLVPRYVTVLVFARDLGILTISGLLYFTGTLREFRPSMVGKLNTFVQVTAVLMVLLEAARAAQPFWGVRHALLVATAWLAPLSAAQYAVIVIRQVGQQAAPHVVTALLVPSQADAVLR